MQSNTAKIIIHTDDAPEAIGAYNQGVQVGNLLFISGQIAIDPKSEDGHTVTDTIEKETEQVMNNIGAILKEAKVDFKNVVKCCVYVRDISQASIINSVYAQFFEDATAPAREFVEVSHLPKRVNIEISAIAWIPSK